MFEDEDPGSWDQERPKPIDPSTLPALLAFARPDAELLGWLVGVSREHQTVYVLPDAADEAERVASVGRYRGRRALEGYRNGLLIEALGQDPDTVRQVRASLVEHHDPSDGRVLDLLDRMDMVIELLELGDALDDLQRGLFVRLLLTHRTDLRDESIDDPEVRAVHASVLPLLDAVIRPRCPRFWARFGHEITEGLQP